MTSREVPALTKVIVRKESDRRVSCNTYKTGKKVLRRKSGRPKSRSRDPLQDEVFADKIVLSHVPLERENRVFVQGVTPTLQFGVPTLEHKFVMPGGASIYVKVWQYGKGQTARMEFNPSRVAFPDPSNGNVHVGGLSKVLRTVEKFLEAEGVGAVNFGSDGVKVTRLDLGRDFVVDTPSPAAILQGLYLVPRKYRPYVSEGRSGPCTETLEVRRKEYNVRLYDQEARHDRPMPTQIRFEVQLKSAQLKKFNFRSAYDIQSVDSLAAVRYFWDWMSMGAEVAPYDDLLARLHAAGFRGKELGNLYGFAAVREWGGAGDYDPKLRKKLEQQLNAAGASGVARSLNTSGHLDLDSGKFVRT